MFRFALVLAVMLVGLGARGLFAQVDDGPPIVITSPDQGTTFAFANLKSRTLYWDKKSQTLVAQVTFVDDHAEGGQSNEDTHQFHLPGITFDQAKGIFYATSAKGEKIPVAQVKKTLFLRDVVSTPNARVRIMHPRGELTVVLEALSPNDPALRQPASDGNGTQKVDFGKLLN